MMSEIVGNITPALALDAACGLADFRTFGERVFRFLDQSTPYHAQLAYQGRPLASRYGLETDG